MKLSEAVGYDSDLAVGGGEKEGEVRNQAIINITMDDWRVCISLYLHTQLL